MFEQLFERLHRRSRSLQEKPGSPAHADDEISRSRRRFFTRTAVGALSVAGTAGVAKTVADAVMPAPDLKRQYQQGARAGELELREREYVVMSQAEKEQMLDSLIEDYRDSS